MLRNQMTWMAALLGAAALTGMVGCSKSQPGPGQGLGLDYRRQPAAIERCGRRDRDHLGWWVEHAPGGSSGGQRRAVRGGGEQPPGHHRLRFHRIGHVQCHSYGLHEWRSDL